MKLMLSCLLVMLMAAIPSLAAENQSNWAISVKALIKPIID